MWGPWLSVHPVLDSSSQAINVSSGSSQLSFTGLITIPIIKDHLLTTPLLPFLPTNSATRIIWTYLIASHKATGTMTTDLNTSGHQATDTSEWGTMKQGTCSRNVRWPSSIVLDSNLDNMPSLSASRLSRDGLLHSITILPKRKVSSSTTCWPLSSLWPLTSGSSEAGKSSSDKPE